MVSSVEDMITEAKKNQSRVLVIDESALAMDRYDPSQLWVAKTSRHGGHASVFIGQDWTDVPKGIRSQCEQIFVFACARDEAYELANRFDSDQLLDCSKQQKGEFFRILLNVSIERGKLDFAKQKILLAPLKTVDQSDV